MPSPNPAHSITLSHTIFAKDILCEAYLAYPIGLKCTKNDFKFDDQICFSIPCPDVPIKYF